MGNRIEKLFSYVFIGSLFFLYGCYKGESTFYKLDHFVAKVKDSTHVSIRFSLSYFKKNGEETDFHESGGYFPMGVLGHTDSIYSLKVRAINRTKMDTVDITNNLSNDCSKNEMEYCYENLSHLIDTYNNTSDEVFEMGDKLVEYEFVFESKYSLTNFDSILVDYKVKPGKIPEKFK